MIDEKLQKLIENEVILRMACHDLSNPLAIILTAVSISQQSDDLDEIKMCLAKIRNAAEEQKNILRNVREAKEALSGSGEIELLPYDLEEAVDRLEFLYESQLEEKDLRLAVKIDPNHRLILANDMLFTNLVLGTLFSNAVKYGDSGSSINISTSGNQKSVVVTFSNEGRIIPKEMMEGLFDLHSRQKRAGTRGERGAGWGLPLLKLTMDRHGGEVKVTSQAKEEGKPASRTTFTLTLQRA